MCGSVRALSGELVDGCPSLKPRVAATIDRYLVHIGWAYRMAGGDDPTATPPVRLELKAARKAVGTRQRQARAIRYKGDVFDVDGPASGICLDTLLKATRGSAQRSRSGTCCGSLMIPAAAGQSWWRSAFTTSRSRRRWRRHAPYRLEQDRSRAGRGFGLPVAGDDARDRALGRTGLY